MLEPREPTVGFLKVGSLSGTFVTLLMTLILLDAPVVAGIKWLALSRLAATATMGSEATCERLSGLINRQVQVCKRNMDVMNSVRMGARKAVDECQYQFQTRRWNCTTLQEGKLFGNALVAGTREAAFVHALSAAGVAHEVTRACSSGELGRCGCDRSVRGQEPDERFQWSGCSDNVLFGTAFSRSFVDVRELRSSRSKHGSARALMNLHNNEAGRKSLENNMRIECKCHGVSGSCELKTCWKAMPSFREVGEMLKEKFDGATEVQQRQHGSRRELVPINTRFKPFTEIDLVYLERSPDFCHMDQKSGSLGTTGRRCNRTSKAIDGCDLLCCGRGAKVHRERVTERCSCKFYWCCYVKCKECTKDVEVSTCI